MRLGQLKQTGKQQRPHFRNRSPHGMALFAEEIPKRDRTGVICVVVEPDLRRPFRERAMQLVLWASRFREAGQIAFDVR